MSAVTRKRRILWIDDEIETLRSHILFLKSRDYEVQAASNGQDGLALLEAESFDAVLLDHRMAGKDGLAVLEEMKDRFPSVPVIMVTQSHEEQLAEEALRHRVDGFLVKPVHAVQVVNTLKRVLDQKRLAAEAIPQEYLEDYRQIQAALTTELDWRDWIELYGALTRWNLRIHELEETGLAVAHRDLYRDCNRAFADYVVRSYPRWVQGEDSPPLSVDVMDRYVLPHVQRGEQVFFVVIDCLRYDQWLVIEPLLGELFDVRRELYYGILPSATAYARNALFSGLFPRQIAERYPSYWVESSGSDQTTNRFEKQLMELKLQRTGLYLKPPPRYFKIFDKRGGEEYRRRLASIDRVSLAALVVNFLDVLTHERSESEVLQQIAPDERGFRSLMASWFYNSDLYEIFRLMAKRPAVVIVTTDHGSILCNRASKVFGNRDTSPSLRFKVGERVHGDPDEAVQIDDPVQFQLPADYPGKNYVLAKEDYYFVYPTEFHTYKRQLQGGFQHGGISMDELLVPLATLRPKGQSR